MSKLSRGRKLDPFTQGLLTFLALVSAMPASANVLCELKRQSMAEVPAPYRVHCKGYQQDAYLATDQAVATVNFLAANGAKLAIRGAGCTVSQISTVYGCAALVAALKEQGISAQAISDEKAGHWSAIELSEATAFLYTYEGRFESKVAELPRWRIGSSATGIDDIVYPGDEADAPRPKARGKNTAR